MAFSYPGYNEMLSGHPDARIDSNEYGPNPNLTVFEWLNGLPDLHGQVSAFATWNTFKDIFNVRAVTCRCTSAGMCRIPAS